MLGQPATAHTSNSYEMASIIGNRFEVWLAAATHRNARILTFTSGAGEPVSDPA